MNRQVALCPQCGAPAGGAEKVCSYCGAEFAPDPAKHRLYLAGTGNHPKLVLAQLEELADSICTQGAAAGFIASAIGELVRNGGKLVGEDPVILLETDDPAEVERWKKRIEENGGLVIAD
jgi:hypothetical protein